MARVINSAKYDKEREVSVGSLRPGHSVLMKDPSGTIVAYMICKVGNTPIHLDDGAKKTVILINFITGRIVTKYPTQKCVVVSSDISITNYYGEFNNVEEQN